MAAWQAVSKVRKRGLDVLHDPLVNKARQAAVAVCSSCADDNCLQGTGFPASERERLGLRGLLPHKTLSVDVQVGAAPLWSTPHPLQS